MELKTFETEQYFGSIDEGLKKELASKEKIYRLTGRGSGVGNRIYFTKKDEKTPAEIFNSGTTLISNYRDVDAETALHKWKVNLINSGINPDEFVKERQDYGTLLHLTYGKILQGQKTNFKNLRNFILDSRQEAHLPKEYATALVDKNINEFKKDVASLLTWIKEMNVKPLAIELMVKSNKYKVATALDLVCEVTTRQKGFWGEVYKTGEKKGEPKETYKDVTEIALVDFKSGKKGFYDKNVLQLLLSREIFEENFPNIKIGSVYNFAPNDWVSSPTYKFYDQERDNSNINFLKKIKDLVFKFGVVEFEHKMENAKITDISGNIGEGSFSVVKSTPQEEADAYWKRTYIDNVDKVEGFILDNELTSKSIIDSFCRNLTDLDLEDIQDFFHEESISNRSDLNKLLQVKLNNKADK